MVLTLLHHILIAPHMLSLPLHRVGKRNLPVVIAVGFDVCLIAHIDTQLIAHLVKTLILRVMGIANVVNVTPLHDEQLLVALLLRHRVAIGMLALVAVHTFELHRHTIYQETTIEQLHIAESDLAGNNLRHTPLLILQIQNKAVQIRFLRAPESGILQRGSQHKAGLRTGFQRGRSRLHTSNRLPGGIQQLTLHGSRSLRRGAVIHIHFHTQITAGVIAHPICLLRKIRMHKEIAHQHLRRAVHIHIPENTGKAPHILALQIRTIGIAVHLRRNHIAPGLHVLRHIEHRCRAAILREAHFVPVYEEIEERIHTIKTQKHLPPGPICRQLHIPPIRTHRIRLRLRRRILLLAVGYRLTHHPGPIPHKSIALVAVNRRTISTHLPITRHIYLCPLAHIRLRLVKIQRTLIRAGGPMELPLPIQAAHKGRIPAVAFQRLIPGGKRHKERAGILASLRQILRIFPIRVGLIGCLAKRQCSRHRNHCSHALQQVHTI